MNRTIKFRGKRVDNGEWVYGFYQELWNPIQGNRIPIIDESLRFDRNGDSISIYEVIPSTVGQFTGLLDKDGKEIYEGDVIHTKTIYGFHSELLQEWKELKKLDSLNDIGSLFEGIVVCDVQRGLMLKRLDNDYAEPLFSRNYNNHCHIEMSLCSIIGSIHDNPELLK